MTTYIINNEEALTLLSEWYTENSIGLFKKIDQIPKAIVSIIEFDFDNPISDVNKCLDDALKIEEAYTYRQQANTKNKSLSKKSRIKKRNELVTCIVSLYLCLDTRRYEDFRRAGKITYSIKNDERINSSRYEVLENTMMFSWSMFEPLGQPERRHDRFYWTLKTEFDEDKQNKMMYRFKKIPISIYSDKKERKVKILSRDTTEDVLETLVNFINSQPSTKPYPYNSSFPLPLRIRKK